MLNILNFFEDATENAGGNNASSWILLIVLALFMVALIVFNSISSKKRKKESEEMMSKLDVGSTVTTIGGIVGEVVQLDDEHIWIKTGTAENFTAIQFLRQAVHSVKAAPGSAEAIAEEKAEKKEANEDDEIK